MSNTLNCKTPYQRHCVPTGKQFRRTKSVHGQTRMQEAKTKSRSRRPIRSFTVRLQEMRHQEMMHQESTNRHHPRHPYPRGELHAYFARHMTKEHVEGAMQLCFNHEIDSLALLFQIMQNDETWKCFIEEPRDQGDADAMDKVYRSLDKLIKDSEPAWPKCIWLNPLFMCSFLKFHLKGSLTPEKLKDLVREVQKSDIRHTRDLYVCCFDTDAERISKHPIKIGLLMKMKKAFLDMSQ